jgi:hypothetical protein
LRVTTGAASLLAMGGARRIRWKWVFLGGFLAELTVLAIFFILLFAAMAAGVPEIAQPMSTLDYIDALIMSFASMFVFTVWVGKRLDSAYVLHGVLIGAFGILLFNLMWFAGTGTLAQPALYVVAHGLKVVGGIVGGLIAEKRYRGTIAAT